MTYGWKLIPQYAHTISSTVSAVVPHGGKFQAIFLDKVLEAGQELVVKSSKISISEAGVWLMAAVKMYPSELLLQRVYWIQPTCSESHPVGFKTMLPSS